MNQFLSRVIFSVLIVSFLLPTYAQGLLPGDQCPDVSLKGWLDEGEPNLLSSWTQKPLLLCFWNKDCEVAYEFLPRLQAFQQSQPDIQVLVVSSQNKEAIEEAFQDKALLSAVHLPLLTADTVFYRLFPHRVEPHVIWLDRSRLVRAITGYEAVRPEPVRSLVSGGTLSFPVKQEVMDKDIYFSRTPLMINEYAESKSKLQGYSYFGLERPSILSHLNMAQYDNQSGTMRIQGVNSSLRKLYQAAYQQLDNFHPAQLVNKAGDVRVVSKAAYCYEVILRDSSKEKAYQYMRADLDRYFGFKSSLRVKKQKVYVLQRAALDNSVINEAKEKKVIDSYHADGKHVFRNVQLRYILASVNQSGQLPLPLVDETGIRGGIDLALTEGDTGLSTIQQDLKKSGLRLVEQKRKLPVILLETKKSSH